MATNAVYVWLRECIIDVDIVKTILYHTHLRINCCISHVIFMYIVNNVVAECMYSIFN